MMIDVDCTRFGSEAKAKVGISCKSLGNIKGIIVVLME